MAGSAVSAWKEAEDPPAAKEEERGHVGDDAENEHKRKSHVGPQGSVSQLTFACPSVQECPSGEVTSAECCHCSAVTGDVAQSARRNRLIRFAEYERPWVGRTGLALGLMLWLFVSAVAFGVGLANGLAVLILGGALIFGEVWIERSGEGHATCATVSRLSWRIGLGVALVVLAIVSSNSWGAALLIFFGAWLLLPALLVATLSWRERREQVVHDDK